MSEDQLMNHKIHIILSVVSLGCWLPFYLALYLFYKLTDSNIGKRAERKETKKAQKQAENSIKSEKRIERSEQRKEFFEQRAKTASSNPSLGYKKGKGTFSSTAYALECNHMIRAKTASKSLNYFQGKTVYCEICKEQRVVVGRPRML